MSEAVGVIEHEAAPSAPDNSFEISEDLSAEEYIRQVMLAETEKDPSLKEKQESEQLEREKTIEQLTDHYGDQIFEYGSHVGTVTAILNLCPMSEYFVKQGFAAVVAWINGYKQKETPEEVEDNPAEDDLNSESSDNEKTEAKKSVIEVKTIIKDDVEEKSARIAVESKAVEIEKPLKIQSEEKILAVDEEVAPIEIVVPETAEQKAEVEITVPEAAPEASAEAATIVERRVIDEEVISEDAPVKMAEIIEEKVPTEKEDVLLEALVQEQASTEIEPIEEVKSFEYFEQWQELAKEETPLDELFVSIVEQLPTQEYETAEMTELTDDEIENLDKNISPELRVMFVEIQKVKKVIEKLYTAKTKEECDAYVEELVLTLTQLLRSLGYDNPEKMIRDFISNYPLSSLYELAEALEQTLRLNITHEATKVVIHNPVQKRHISFGKFVLYMLQTLSGKSAATDLA